MNPTFLFVSILGGLLMAFLDALVNANPLAVRLYASYKPIARTRMNTGVAVVIDLVYGLLMGVIFVVLSGSLPGGNAILKGLSYGVLVWLFKVAMQSASQWVMFNIPLRSLLYSAVAGLGEMLVMGVFYGLILPLAS